MSKKEYKRYIKYGGVQKKNWSPKQTGAQKNKNTIFNTPPPLSNWEYKFFMPNLDCSSFNVDGGRGLVKISDVWMEKGMVVDFYVFSAFVKDLI